MGFKVKPNRNVYTIEEMGIERIYLFGSYARGEATPESDVDLVVDSDSIDSYLDIGRLYVRLNRALEKNVDVVPSDAGETFMDSIRDDLVLIHGS